MLCLTLFKTIKAILRLSYRNLYKTWTLGNEYRLGYKYTDLYTFQLLYSPNIVDFVPITFFKLNKCT